MIYVESFNEVFVKIRCEDTGVEQEIADFFTFMIPGAKFQPKFRSGMWDGKLRLFNLRTKTLYKGLVSVLQKFATQRQYSITLCSSLEVESHCESITIEFIQGFIEKLNLRGRGQPVEVRDYQLAAIHRIVSMSRNIVLAATSSGKSLILYSAIRFHLLKKRRVLLIVPTVNLVNQMIGDFSDYSSENKWNVEEHVHGLYSGQEKDSDKPVLVSTWQSLASIQKNNPRLFKKITENTDVLLCDETHTMKSAATSKLLEAFTTTAYRTGVSGTLDGTQINELVLVGLLGPIYRAVTAKQLMDRGQVVNLKIKILLLKHPEHTRKALKGMDHKEEIKHIVGCQSRNDFISKLSVSTKGNTLILFNFVSHGAHLFENVKSRVESTRNVYFIHGGVDSEERERIRKIVDSEQNSIILATSSLFSTGTNIPSLENIIFAIPTKSNIRIRQSIGRGLRLNKDKECCTVYDIADDFRVGKSYTNTTYNHLESRVAIYTSEQFDYKLYNFDLQYS
jgi:superfamily II DNA or RNA helicase